MRFTPTLFISSTLLISSVSCVKLGPELSPYPRPDVEGFVVTLHRANSEEYQIAVWHPQGHYYSFGESTLPFQAKLIGDPQSPRTSSSEKFSFSHQSFETGVGVRVGSIQAVAETSTGTHQSTVTRTARTAWNFSRARWDERRPFRLVFIRGYSPIAPESRMEFEIGLGPTVGSAEGLSIRKISKDPVH